MKANLPSHVAGALQKGQRHIFKYQQRDLGLIQHASSACQLYSSGSSGESPATILQSTPTESVPEGKSRGKEIDLPQPDLSVLRGMACDQTVGLRSSLPQKKRIRRR